MEALGQGRKQNVKGRLFVVSRVCPKVRFNERGGRRLPQGETLRHVDMFHLIRNSVEDGLQQGFVAENNGDFALFHGGVCQLLTQPLVHILRLHRFGGCSHVFNVLDMAEVVKRFSWQFVAKEFQIAGDEGASLVKGTFVQVIFVEIPIEQGALLLLQIEEQPLLHLAQHIETHHYVRHVWVGQCQLATF